jgi:hypothetical protein
MVLHLPSSAPVSHKSTLFKNSGNKYPGNGERSLGQCSDFFDPFRCDQNHFLIEQGATRPEGTERLPGVVSTVWLALFSIVRPHPQDMDCLGVLKDLVYKSMLNIDSPRVAAQEITGQNTQPRRSPIGIDFENFDQFDRLILEIAFLEF